MKDYSIGAAIRQGLIIAGVILNLIVWGCVVYLHFTRPAPVRGVDWVPMANQNIDWNQ
jgi:hypothetical protein